MIAVFQAGASKTSMSDGPFWNSGQVSRSIPSRRWIPTPKIEPSSSVRRRLSLILYYTLLYYTINSLVWRTLSLWSWYFSYCPLESKAPIWVEWALTSERTVQPAEELKRFYWRYLWTKLTSVPHPCVFGLVFGGDQQVALRMRSSIWAAPFVWLSGTLQSLASG